MPDIVTAASQQPPPAEFVAQVEARMGNRSTGWARPETGLSAALRFTVTFADGRRVFVKAATTPETEAWLRNERLALGSSSRELAPEIIDWFPSASGFSVLVTEALDGHWPASHGGVDWRGGLDSTIAAIERLSATPGPPVLPQAPGRVSGPSWGDSRLTAETAAAGIASDGWLREHLPALRTAEVELDRSGSAFVHGDMRSDNVCLMPDGPRFVDWSSAARGAPQTDLAAFLPAARLEGGPPPEAVLPDGGSWAAAQAAQAATMAASHDLPAWLRRVCWRLTAINVDWAVASLGLAPRDGTPWKEL